MGFSKWLWIILIVGILILVFVFWRPWKKNDPEPSATNQQTNPTTPSSPTSRVPENPEKDTVMIAFDLPQGGKGDVIDHECFVLSYVEQFEQPEWTSYVLDGTPMIKIRRDDHSFREDMAIPTESASLADYRNSGYDRGHLVPAADMKTSLDCYGKSFLLSNISPQDHGFNTGLWRRLEESVRKWSRKRTPLQVVSGPILSKDLNKAIGKVTRIPIPKEYFKVIVHRSSSGYKAIGFLMPNKDSDLSIEKYAVSITQIEQRAGLDFNKSLPDSLEKALENNLDLKYWFN